MPKNCKNCGVNFEVTAEDLAFYDKVSPVIAGVKYSVPEPTHCPDCRLQRRLSFRNERSLHYRNCNSTGRKIVSMYSPEVRFPVYDNDEWWKDSWSGLQYGREFDFHQTFSEQFYELMSVVPKMARVQQGENINSEFTNCASYNKNCYLVFSSNKSEDCTYCTWVDSSKNCMDCFVLFDSELCYECINGVNLYNCYFAQNSAQCTDCRFILDCTGCKNCFGCVGLVHKEYCIWNVQYTKEQYELEIAKFELSSYANLENIKSKFLEFSLIFPRKFMEGVRNENVSGNYIVGSKNSFECYDVLNLEDCKWCDSSRFMKNSYDVSHYGITNENQLLYEGEGVGHGVSSVLFSKLVWGGSNNVMYCYECFACKDCFGCTGIKHKQYCILNKQYTKEEYEILVPKIIEYMKSTGEWGEFFNPKLSPFAYNETVAVEYFPMDRVAIESKGLRWLEKSNLNQNYEGDYFVLPDTLNELNQEITKRILKSETSGKLYKVVPTELEFYIKASLPIPRITPDERHLNRLEKRNPRKLFSRICDYCNIEIETVYAPDRPEKVYCEKCYLTSVYA